MKRREFLVTTSTLIGTVSYANLFPNAINNYMSENKYKFNVGKFKCTIFRDLMFKYQAKDYFINADKEELDKALNKYEINPENIPSPFISMLLETANKKILIDTGTGYSDEPIIFRGNKIMIKGRLSELLKEEGIRSDEITDVILTHFHPDHIGGVYSDEKQLNFPKAKFHVHEEEWEYWHTSKSDNQIPLFKYFVENNVSPLSNQDLNLIKGDNKEIIPGIRVIKATGHTPGQIAIIINSGKGEKQVLYISDTFLHPLHMEQIGWQTNYDLDHKKAKKTRKKMLELAYKENMLINAFHFDFPGLGRIDKVKKDWRWNYL
jgi:glyoxylase-like metal-dependent hydrolase (beta-lactamase superfamily II)